MYYFIHSFGKIHYVPTVYQELFKVGEQGKSSFQSPVITFKGPRLGASGGHASFRALKRTHFSQFS